MTNTRVLLGMSVQRALLGAVSPALRAVGVNGVDDEVRSLFFVDGPIDDADRESASEVETDVLADLQPAARVCTSIIRLDAPAQLPPADFWAYRRREPDDASAVAGAAVSR